MCAISAHAPSVARARRMLQVQLVSALASDPTPSGVRRPRSEARSRPTPWRTSSPDTRINDAMGFHLLIHDRRTVASARRRSRSSDCLVQMKPTNSPGAFDRIHRVGLSGALWTSDLFRPLDAADQGPPDHLSTRPSPLETGSWGATSTTYGMAVSDDRKVVPFENRPLGSVDKAVIRRMAPVHAHVDRLLKLRRG